MVDNMLDQKDGNYWIEESIKNVQFEQFYRLGPELGRGATSTVYKCIELGNGDAWAVKVICKRRKNAKAELKKEIGLLLHLHHPNLIRLKEVYETPEKIHLVSELAKGGELFDSIVVRGRYTEKHASKVIRDLLEAMEYMHNNDIVHRDLKPENLLLEDLTDLPRLKVADFGLSTIEEVDVLIKMVCSSPGYTAPEMLTEGNSSFAVDSWTCGVIAFILLCGYEPFYEPELCDTYKRVRKADYSFDPPYWDAISENAKDFVKKMIQLDPKQRLTARQALRHPWVRGTAAKNDHLPLAHEGLKKFNGARKLKALTDCVLLSVWASKRNTQDDFEQKDASKQAET